MALLSDMRYLPLLTSEEVVPETDLIGVWHPSGLATGRAVSLATLKQALLSGGGGGGDTVSRAEFDALKASVITDLNALRDAICLTNASLDADAGVATTTYAENGDPPPLVTE